MKLKRIIGFLLGVILMQSCQSDYFTIEDAVKSSKVIIQHYQNNSLNKFKTYNYWWRGGDIWDKRNKDSTFYRILFFPNVAHNRIRVGTHWSFSFFLADFPMTLKIDTCGLNEIEFRKGDDNEMQITLEYYIQSNLSKRIIKTTQNVFRGNDPFSYFNNLLVETPKYRITDIDYRSWTDCYSFQIAPNYFLNYIPDSSILKTCLPRMLKMHLVNTYRLNRNWYLGPRK
jgi:hypothetical protein